MPNGTQPGSPTHFGTGEGLILPGAYDVVYDEGTVPGDWLDADEGTSLTYHWGSQEIEHEWDKQEQAYLSPLRNGRRTKRQFFLAPDGTIRMFSIVVDEAGGAVTEGTWATLTPRP